MRCTVEPDDQVIVRCPPKVRRALYIILLRGTSTRFTNVMNGFAVSFRKGSPRKRDKPEDFVSIISSAIFIPSNVFRRRRNSGGNIDRRGFKITSTLYLPDSDYCTLPVFWRLSYLKQKTSLPKTHSEKNKNK